jgi:Ca2+-binding EF-hand superfamily protein
MDLVVPYLRKQYHESSKMSLSLLKQLFKALDIDETGELSPHEVEYLLKVNATGITTEEIDAFIDFLDVDGDRQLTWNEFARVFSYINDNARINR